nr:unnamed protein product [Callosobruchus analis]
MESEACSSTSSSEFEENLENVAAFLLLHEGKRKKWVHEINVRREELGEYHRLVQELNEHPDRYHMYFRMTKDEFNFLHELIKEDIKKQNTQFRRAISTEERLAVCLRFLATGNSFRSMGFSYRLGFSTVREIVIEVCDAIWKNLGPIVMPEPTTDIWMKSAEKFKQIWDFPNCIAAIDGKHINIHHSIVLLALVDADYKFITIDIGAYGRNSDGGIFEKSEIGKKLQRGTFSVPGNVPLKTNGLPQPHIIVGDEAFPLKLICLRPYSRFHLYENEPNKIYNYRLSRARRVVENAFRILVARWRVFRRHLEVQPYLVDKINPIFLRYVHERRLFKISKGYEEITPMMPSELERLLKNIFNSPIGAVPWQIGMLPTSTEQWLAISERFEKQWNFPHCIGAIDGKHVVLQAPIGSGSEYFNYKSFFSIVLFALVDADYNFLYANVGCQGRISDGGVFKNTSLWKKIEDGSLTSIKPRPLPGRQKDIPYLILGDDAFALNENVMKPFAGVHQKGSAERIFNYRLSRARRVVENAFGILSAVFRVLRKPLLLQPDRAKTIVLTAIYLHNFLRQSTSSRNIYTPRGTFDSEENGKFIAGTWRQECTSTESLLSLKKVPRKSPRSAQEVRNEIAEYMMNDGRVPWQNDYA